MSPSGADLLDLRGEVLRVAGSTLSAAQFRCFVLYWFAGWTEQAIADHYGCTQPAVHAALWGQKKGRETTSGGAVRRIQAALVATGGGAMSKLGKAIEEDEQLTQVLTSLKNEPTPTPSSLSSLGWYRGVRPEHFAALAVLLQMTQLADARRQLHISTIAAEVPRATLSMALTTLRVLGHITTDGINITIVKTPTQTEENHADA
jgi:hypothetical protein